MIAAARDARRGAFHIEVDRAPTKVGVSSAELASYEQSINDAIDWLYKLRAETQFPKSNVMLAVATAIGLVVGRECPSDQIDFFVAMISERIASIARKMKEER